MGLLGALVIAAPGAHAVVGTTAFTCQNVGTGGSFIREHCAAGDAGAGNYAHVGIPEKAETELAVTNERTGPETTGEVGITFKTNFAGEPLEFIATGVRGSGSIVNRTFGPKLHYVEGTVTLEFIGTAIKGTGYAAGCEIKKFVTEKLKLTSLNQGMSLKLSPAAGEIFATVTIQGCIYLPGFNQTNPIQGSVNATVDGATLTFNHATTTEQESLSFGSTMGVDGALTLSARAEAKDSYKPLGFTTVETN